MTKEELKEYIKQLKLESDLEGVVFELVDNAKEVNAELLNGIADILDLQADFYEKVADVLEEEAKVYNSLDAEVSRIDSDIQNRRAEEISNLQETFTEEVTKKIQEMKIEEPSPVPTESSFPNSPTTTPATSGT